MKKFDLDIMLFTNGPNAYAPKRLLLESKKLGFRMSIIKYKDVNIVYKSEGIEINKNGKKMPIPRAIILRGLGEDSKFNPIRAAMITWFKSKGTKILNEKSISKWPSLDKTTQHICFVDKGVPIADSYSFSSIDELSKWSKNAYPYIAKDVIGSSGIGVYKISNIKDFHSLIKKFNSNFKIKGLLFQKLLPNAQDLRVIVLNGKVLGAMKRTALPGTFLSNFSQGGRVEPYNIKQDRKANALALKTSKIFKLDYSGIDLMKDGMGNWVVLEVNRACQFEGFEKSTQINIAKEIAKFLVK